MTSQSKLQKRIMRRVYLLHVVRLMLRPAVVKTALVLVLLLQVSRYVSFGAVMENMPHSYSALPGFISGAVANTETVTLTLLAATLALGIWLMRDVFSSRMHVASV